jgi:hypothetical protein
LELGGEHILYDCKDPGYKEMTKFLQYMGEGSSESANGTGAYFLYL